MAYHGYPRYTGDIDIFIRRSPENAARVASVLDSFGFGGLGADADTFLKPDRVVQLGRPPNRIDGLTWISGVDFEDAWPNRERAFLDGVLVAMIGRDAFSQTGGEPSAAETITGVVDRLKSSDPKR